MGRRGAEGVPMRRVHRLETRPASADMLARVCTTLRSGGRAGGGAGARKEKCPIVRTREVPADGEVK